ncbi:MAG: signal peptidase II [Bacteroidota bacterium]
MRVLVLTGMIIVCDQITKFLVKGFSIPLLGFDWQGMAYGSTIPILGDFFRLTYIENPGMAFGIDLGGKLFFSLFSLAASVAVFAYLYRERNASLGFRIALAMILGGAVGNLVDRALYGVLFGNAPLFYGSVVDFFDVDFFDISILGYHLSRWPVFNIADASVTTGVILLLLFYRGARLPGTEHAGPASAAAGPVAPASVKDALGDGHASRD